MEDDYMMLDDAHILRLKEARDGTGWSGDVIVLSRPADAKGKRGKAQLTATHLFDVPPQPDQDTLRSWAERALRAYREG